MRRRHGDLAFHVAALNYGRFFVSAVLLNEWSASGGADESGAARLSGSTIRRAYGA